MAAPALSIRRKLLCAAILACGTLILFAGGFELALRLVGYGHSADFARRVTLPSGETVWRENRWCTAPYFSAQLVRRPQPFRLSEKKSAGTCRIFVLGSSAAMGDPEASFSFARVLEAMLRAAYPQQRFEVVNAAVTAINSHVARGIAEDCAKLEPDLFIVYEGHNEVIGPFGPAGVFTPFLRRPALLRASAWLKTTRTGQLLAHASRRLAPNRAPTEWGGMQMFLQQQIAASDPRLADVRAQFRSHLSAIAKAAQRAGAATLLCTVLANQRDFAPFMSRHRPNLGAEDLARWNSHFTAAERAAQAGETATAEREYRAALALDDQHAELAFRLGRLALQAGRVDEAKTLLLRALDLDALRFRTDSALNEVIRQFHAAHPPNLAVVDLERALASRSEHGIPGDDLLYEHVHLTFRGAFEVARELFPHVAAELVRRGIGREPAAAPLSYDEARRRLGCTAHEQAMIALELLSRFRAPPFTGQSDSVHRIAAWTRRSEKAAELLARPDALPALRELYRQALAAAPDDWILARNAGMMFVSRGASAEALPLLERALAWIDDDVDTLIALGTAQRQLGQTEAAERTFAQARTLEPRHPELTRR